MLTLHTLVQNVTKQNLNPAAEGITYTPYIRTECNPLSIWRKLHNLSSYTPYTRTECNSKSIQKYGSVYADFTHRISISGMDITLLSKIMLV